MENLQAPNEVAIIEKSIEVFKSAPQVLLQNQDRTRKAMVVGNNILDQWEAAWIIVDETERITALSAVDERSNKFMANCSVALREEKEVRAAITQLMDNFRKMFTATENQLDAAGANTTPNKVQNQRNTYAIEMNKIAVARKKAADDKANKEKEQSQIIADIEKTVFNWYSNLLRTKKDSLNNRFNNVKLDTIANLEEDLHNFKPQLSIDHYKAVEIIGRVFFHSKEEILAFLDNANKVSFLNNEGNYKAELSLLRDELIEQLPSKLNELKELLKLQQEQEQLRLKAETDKEASAELDRNKAAQKKIEDDKLERETLEKKRLDDEEAAANAIEINKIEVKEQGAATMAMFSREETIAETIAPAVKLGFEIIILHPVAYTQIMAMWFEHFGKNLAIDKIGNTKLDQMKAWCEKKAFDDGLKIESKFLRYDDVVKAKTVKAKAEKV